LKLVDWNESDIVNLNGPFKRGNAGLLEKVQKSIDQEDKQAERPKTKQELKKEKLAAKEALKEKKKREKLIKGKQ
jgi:hypothetical protein